MIATFVIFLREGIEAMMIVALLLAFLSRVGQRERFRDVYLGVGAALGLVLVGGVAAYLFITQYSGSRAQTYFETATYLLAAGVLTVMTFWMQKHARTMHHELEARGNVAISTEGRWGLALLSFQAVGREGLETMVFTLAIVFANRTQSAAPQSGRLMIFGAVAGLLVAGGLAFVIYRLGARVNLKWFFRVVGVVLMLFAAGLLADAIENIQSLGWLTLGNHVMWSTAGAVTEQSNLGDTLHALLGYADRPTVLQGVVWIGYVVLSVGSFVLLNRSTKRRPSPRH